MNVHSPETMQDAHAMALHDAARGLLRTARQWKAMNRPDEVARLVKIARWYWRRYRMEMAHG